jgi:RNA polymerase sigma-70 factor (ECF subfamily)
MNDESKLIARCRAGDHAAWDELFDSSYSPAARFVFQLAPDFSLEDVEDICQETFLSAVRRIDSFDGRSRFQTWLFRIAANKAKDYRRSLNVAKRGGGARPVSLDDPSDENHRPIDPPAPDVPPDLSLLNSEQWAQLRQGLDRLDEECREVLELRYYGDLSYEDIAATLHLNAKTVSSRLSRCLQRLAVVMREIRGHERGFIV